MIECYLITHLSISTELMPTNLMYDTLKPLYLKHVDNGFLKYTHSNYIELILKTSYLHILPREVLLYFLSILTLLSLY